MFYTDMTDQLTFLITVCFSFYMFVSAFCFKNAGPLPRLLGLAFLIPFLLLSAAFMANSSPFSPTLSALAEPALLLFIFILLLAKPGQRHFSLMVLLLSVFSIGLIFAASRPAFLQSFTQVPQNRLLLLIIPVVSNLYLLKKDNGPKAFIFWGLLPLTAGSAIDCYLDYGFYSYLVPLLKLTAYGLFAMHFYREYFQHLMRKTEEAEKKITRVNRNLDLEVKKRIMEIERVHQNLVNISKTDSLSKAMNKAAILDAIENLIVTRQKSEFSILMYDIDNFKHVNDTFGHVTGDKCIRSLSALAKSNLREFDLIGRYGGDEFIIVLPGTTIHQALQIAERFRQKVETTKSPHYTISIGVASYPKDGTTTEALVEAADKSLYKSKARGKNAVSGRD